jgi:hypothetical protein
MPALRAFSQYRLGLELTQMSQFVSRASRCLLAPSPPRGVATRRESLSRKRQVKHAGSAMRLE